jgi:hypothetical protein
MKEIGLLVLVGSMALAATAQLPLGNPLAGLERLKDFEAMRASSCDPDWKSGNNDFRSIEAGATLLVAELEGPGVITHIWNTIAHEAPNYSRLMTLRIYWDGEEHPSVEAPIGDFFGIGHGIDKPFVSVPIKVSADGRARNCYWPMPFRKSAKITVTNESDRRCHALYFYVDWQKHASIPDDAAYFHAMYRQEFPCIMGRNYVLADIIGRGHYVGTMQSVEAMSSGWYGEGDDFFFIDGEKEPRLRGTGTEDYFCDAWGFRQQDGPFYGTPLWEGFEPGHKTSTYRFHITDSVPFKKSLRVEIEHKGSQQFPDGSGSGFIERDDLMSSVALWYQVEPHKPWAAFPTGQDRLPNRTLKLVRGWEAVPKAKHSVAPLEVQDLPGVAKEGRQLWFRPEDESGWIELSFELPKEVTGNLWSKFIHSWDYGIYQIKLDGESIAKLDLYAEKPTRKCYDWGKRTLSSGTHVLRVECVAKSDNSKGYFLGFDSLDVLTRVYERPAGFDLRTLQVKKAE